MRQQSIILGLFLFALLACMADVLSGSLWIPLADVWDVLRGNNAAMNGVIIVQYRIPKMLGAVCAGIALPLSGLLMQTLFRNPLAGPFVLGVSSGASLGVALFVMAAGAASSGIGIAAGQAGFATAGALAVMGGVLLTAARRLQDQSSLLIVGMMVSSAVSAAVSVLQYVAPAEQLQKFVIWTLGSLGGIDWPQLTVLVPACIVGGLASFALHKQMDAMLLGHDYAQSLGVPVRGLRIAMILISGVLAGVVTAFAGPIAFVGIAVPHAAKALMRTESHRWIVPACALIGIALMCICDALSSIGINDRQLPINSITALFGAPAVLWIISRQNRMK